MDSIRYLLTIPNSLEDNIRIPSGMTSSEAPESNEISPGNYLRDVLGFDLFGNNPYGKLGDADLSIKFDDKYKANPKYTRGDSGLINTGPLGLLFENNRQANPIDASWIANYHLQLQNPLLPFIAVGLFLSPVITIPTILAQDSLQRAMDWYTKTFGIETAS